MQTFLGLDFDLFAVSSAGCITFWVRERLELKVRDGLASARSDDKLTSGSAWFSQRTPVVFSISLNKVFGVESGVAALRPLKDLKPQRPFCLARPCPSPIF